MRIGVDVDGVLTDLEAYQLKYGKNTLRMLRILMRLVMIFVIFFIVRKKKEKSFGLSIFGNIV